MRLLILFISLLISQIGNGQIINASPPYRVTATAACSKLLDQYSGAAAAYSLRLLDCDYAGSAIRVRRSSDNTESDIGFTANGDLDTASLKTFVGTGGTDDGFVVTWYDQSGNSRDLSQATAGNQPLIIDNGVVLRQDGGVALRWTNASGTYMNTSATGWVGLQTNSIFAAFKSVTLVSFAGIVVPAPSSGNDWASNAGMFIGNYGTINFQAQGGAASAYDIIGGTPSTYSILTHIINSGSGEMWQNGSSLATDSYGSFSSTNSGSLYIGIRYLSGGPNTTYSYNGYFQEIVIYNSNESANRTNIESNINTYWGVY